jgi:antirestriction protein ArdC
MKGYTVFNTSKSTGCPRSTSTAPRPALPPMELHEAAEAFFAGTGATVRHGGSRAFYVPSQDFVQLPPRGGLQGRRRATPPPRPMSSSTGPATPPATPASSASASETDAYAFEELVAELGAAFLCADLGITPEVREDHAAYLAHWLQVLKQDKRAIFTAAAAAQRAADTLHALQVAEPGPACSLTGRPAPPQASRPGAAHS